MVARGFAFHYVRYSADIELLTIEAEAKAANRGVWSFGGSQRPDEFRAKRHTERTMKRRR
jgi:endonuclease YncB( thermonuclease family)